jgi:hypothetical protein
MLNTSYRKSSKVVTGAVAKRKGAKKVRLSKAERAGVKRIEKADKEAAKAESKVLEIPTVVKPVAPVAPMTVDEMRAFVLAHSLTGNLNEKQTKTVQHNVAVMKEEALQKYVSSVQRQQAGVKAVEQEAAKTVKTAKAVKVDEQPKVKRTAAADIAVGETVRFFCMHCHEPQDVVVTAIEPGRNEDRRRARGICPACNKRVHKGFRIPTA